MKKKGEGRKKKGEGRKKKGEMRKKKGEGVNDFTIFLWILSSLFKLYAVNNVESWLYLLPSKFLCSIIGLSHLIIHDYVVR